MNLKQLKLALITLGITLASFSSAAIAKKPLFVGNIAQKVNPFLPLMPRKADLDSIRAYGYLRVLHLDNKVTSHEVRLLKSFADTQEIKILYISVRDLQRGHTLLKLGLADVLIGDNTVSEGLVKSLPVNKKTSSPNFWTVRSSNHLLKHSINNLLNTAQISENLPENYHADLNELKQRKLLRIATHSDPNNYFLKKGSPAGFEYELIQKFADQQGLWLEVLIAKNEEEKLKWVENGKADIAITRSHLSHHKLSSSLPFYPAENFVITKKPAKRFHNYHDLHGKKILVHSNPNTIKQVKLLTEKGLKFSIVKSEKNISISDFLKQISEQNYQYGIISAYDFTKVKKLNHELQVVMADNQSSLRLWTVNKKNKLLYQASTQFLKNEISGKFYNIVYKRYFPKKDQLKTKQTKPTLNISPYDHLAKKYADEYKFDWRLILAQMYQESQFKPDAKSSSGAKGLMQIMPNTAKELSLLNVEDPEAGIEAGIRYMKKLRDRYKNDLVASEQNWFTLASYNAGYERIQDARKFAKKLGLDPNRWFDNVELAMQELAKPQNRKQTRFGYCQCGQTVVYLRSIRQLYNSYIQLTDPLLASSYSLN